MRAEWLEDIRRDNRSGAATLAARAAGALAEWLAAGPSAEEVGAVLRELVRAQPRMAPLVNLAARVLEAGPEAAAACREFLRRLEEDARAVSREASALVAGAVLTHSYSSTVRAALEHAWRQGRRFSVILTESRPMREGVRLARELAGEGIPVRLVPDAAAGAFVREARVVLIGADAVTFEGVVNKIGTWPLALAARESGVPVYALASAEKFLPAGYTLPPEPEHDPREVLEAAVPGVTVLNPYFETTPWELLAGLVSEEGVLAPREVLERLGRRSAPPSLAAG